MGCASLGILRSSSVTKQVNFNKTKIGEKCQIFIIQMRHFWGLSNNVRVLEYRGQAVLPDRSTSIRQKLVKNAKNQKFKWDILV